MSARFEAAAKTLSGLDTLEWLRLSGGIHPNFGYHQVPFLGWRFTNRKEEHARIVEAAIQAAETTWGWGLDASRRNWLLAPLRILPAQGGFDERVEMAMRDQEFCVEALDDLDSLIRALRDLTTLPNEPS
ncbi:hypothetical protein ACGFRB_18315 [Streptomyces sp. NPDC048718]|uniref:hypothetical protein n=1 Tax=Streptomyces sp. NPDC048718 TaxID=3365587 RepID=UPI00371A5CAE